MSDRPKIFIRLADSLTSDSDGPGQAGTHWTQPAPAAPPTSRRACACVRACVLACVRACMRACVCVCVCACVSVRARVSVPVPASLRARGHV